MKKLLSLAIIFSLLFTFSACSGSADPYETAKSYVDKDVSGLIEKIGDPESENYSHSCLGDGEDGELVYDGFTVYTYREGDSEVVLDVFED